MRVYSHVVHRVALRTISLTRGNLLGRICSDLGSDPFSRRSLTCPQALAAGLIDAECADEDLRKTAFQKAGSCLGNLAHLQNFTPASYTMMKKEHTTRSFDGHVSGMAL